MNKPNLPEVITAEDVSADRLDPLDVPGESSGPVCQLDPNGPTSLSDPSGPNDSDSTANPSMSAGGQALADSIFVGEPADLAALPPEWAGRLVQVQKLAAMGTMAAMLAHEFNNILTRASNYADQALRNSEDRELTRTALQKVLDNCTKAAEISRSIFDFAGNSDDRRRPVVLAKLVAEAITCLGRDPARDNIAIRTRVPTDLTVQADGTLLQQVVFNLLLNARQAILTRDRGSRGGRITVSAERTLSGQVLIRLADTGCGIPPEAIGRIFTPFFSTKSKSDKAERKGIGLGLAICKSIITDHGGTIEVESVVGQGATFIITLPGN